MNSIQLAKERAQMKMGQRKEAVLKKIENNDVRAVSLASCIALLQTLHLTEQASRFPCSAFDCLECPLLLRSAKYLQSEQSQQGGAGLRALDLRLLPSFP